MRHKVHRGNFKAVFFAMARSDWFRGLATKIGIFVAFIIAAVAIGWGWNYGLRHEQIYEQEARQGYFDQSDNGCYQIAQPPMQGSSVQQANRKPCTPSEEAKQENDSRRHYAELVAQRSSALWAKIMGIAALIGIGLSLLGVVLVANTFRETRKANDLSAKFQRARIKVTLKITDHADLISYSAGIELENIGASVATDVYVRSNIFDKPPDSPMISDMQSYKHTIKQGDKILVSATHPTIDYLDESFFAGYVVYNTVFGGPHYSYFCLRLSIVPSRPGIVGPSRAGIPETPSHWPTDT
jgi:hypothetical protein